MLFVGTRWPPVEASFMRRFRSVGYYVIAGAVLAMHGPAVADVALKFGVYTSEKPTTMVAKFRPSLSVLEKRLAAILGEPVQIKIQVARSYGRGVSDLVVGKVDFSRFGPASYIHAKARNPEISILAVESVGGRKEFYGVICVQKGGPIREVSQIAGKTFAFGSKNSTIGRYLSQLYLLERGITANRLKSFSYLGRHDRVGTAVGLGQFDAGALKDNTFRRLVAKGIPIREIARFPNVTKPWIARAGLSLRVREALTKALLSIEDRKALRALSKDGFLLGEDRDYDVIRKALGRNQEFFRIESARQGR